MDLVGVGQRQAQPGLVGNIVGIAEQGLAELLGGLLDLARHPLQGHEILIHGGIPGEPSATQRARAPRASSGNLNPATELRNSLVMPASLPIDCAVAVVPAEVCEVIS